MLGSSATRVGRARAAHPTQVFALYVYGSKLTVSGALGAVERPSALMRNLVTRGLASSVVVKPGPPGLPVPGLMPSAVKYAPWRTPLHPVEIAAPWKVVRSGTKDSTPAGIA